MSHEVAHERFVWDVTTALEALGAADVALWTWEPETRPPAPDRRRPRPGPGPARPRMLLRRPAALALPQDRDLAEDMLQPQPPGAEVAGAPAHARRRHLHLARRLAGGGRCAPPASSRPRPVRRLRPRRAHRPAGPPAASSPAPASGCRAAGDHELVVADLDRLRRLNEALGHERADLVLAALGSRLAAAFPPDAVLAPDRRGRVRRPGAGRRRRPAAEAMRRGAGAAAARRRLRHPSRPCRIGAVEADGGADAPEAAELLRRAELAVESAKSRRPRRRRRLRPRRWKATACRAWRWRATCKGALRPRRARALLPADRAALDRRALRLRGPGPLAPSRAAAWCSPDDFLPLGRRDGPDGGAGRA